MLSTRSNTNADSAINNEITAKPDTTNAINSNTNPVITIQLNNPVNPPVSINPSLPNSQSLPTNPSLPNNPSIQTTNVNNNIDNNLDNKEPHESSTTTIAEQFHKSEMDIFNATDDKKSEENIVKHINFKLSDIPDTQQFAKEISLDKNTDGKIFVNMSGNKFNIYNTNKQPIGSFNVDHLMRFIAENYDTKQQFMRQINSKEYKDAKQIIKTFLCSTTFDPKINYVNINLISHNDSAFMGDIEMIIKLNKLIQIFVKSKLQDELKYVDPNNRKRIEHIINQFMYMMLNYTMGLIDIISCEIKDNPSKKELALELIKYSIGIMYRISKFVQEQLVIVVNNNKDVEKLMIMSMKMRSILDTKLDKLLNQIELQNSRLLQSGGSNNNNKSNNKSKNNSEILNLNSSDTTTSSSETTSIELSKSVSTGKPYNFDAESHFSAILDI